MRSATITLAVALLAAPGIHAGVYSGEWEYQALNSGDTNFKVEHEGEGITFYRVLWPEFEGKRYKLEHLYKGKLKGKAVFGQMWVREEGVAEFERLRKFDGSVLESDRMDMDGMPLKRIGDLPLAEAVRPPDPPDADEGPGSGATKSAPLAIPVLVPVGRQVQTAAGKRVDQALAEGDRAYARKDYARAVERYQAAYQLDAGRVELLYKLGLCHGILGSQALRAGQREPAAGHYEAAIVNWVKAVRLDPYNVGARENIRRARAKLAKL